MEHRIVGELEEVIHVQQLPEVEIANVVHVRDGGQGEGDVDVDGNGNGNGGWLRQLDEVQMQAIRLENPEIAMLLDAPQEPPIELRHILEPVHVPQRPRKKRSFLTISKPFHVQPERCALIANGWRAVQCVQPVNRCEYFANYLNEHMTSRNYPNGEGLPQRWGQH